jgi:hypothetical protein
LDNIPLTSTYFTREGYLRDRPIVTTCGIFEYLNDDGVTSHFELRLPEEVFARESLESYKGKPIIVTHDAGEITKDNVGEEQIGTILGAGIKDADNVRADIVIHDTDKLQCGLRELSLGYDADIEETSGTYNGQHYDCIQRNIRINHLALVGEARAGHKARLNIDGKTKKSQKGGKKDMKKKKLDGMASALTPEQLEAAVAMYLAANPEVSAATADGEGEEESPLERIRQNADRRDEDIDAVGVEEIPEMHEEIKTLLSEIDQLQAQNDMTGDEDDDPTNTDEGDDPENTGNSDEGCDPDKQDDDDTQDPAVDPAVKMDGMVERKMAEMFAIGRMAAKLNLDGFTPKSLLDGKCQIIKSVNPKLKLDGKSRAYIEAAYDLACDQIRHKKTPASQISKVYGTPANRADGRGASKAEESRDRMIKNMTKKGAKK